MTLETLLLTGLKALLLDLDDTLYAYEPAHRQAIRAAHAKLPRPLSFEEFYPAYCTARERVTQRLQPQGACRSRFFAFQELCESWGVAGAFQHAFDLEEVYWSRFVDVMQADNAALLLIKRAKEAGLKLCIVSDMTVNVQVRKIAKLGLTEMVDYLVTSEEVGAEKPDARMFHAALAKLKLAPHETIMIGDNLKKDIHGAAACGIKTHHYVAKKT